MEAGSLRHLPPKAADRFTLDAMVMITPFDIRDSRRHCGYLLVAAKVLCEQPNTLNRH
jgi:hypothetical protein